MSALILLDDFFRFSKPIVGERGTELQLLRSQGVLVHKAAILPPDTLKRIAEANNLRLKLVKIVGATNFSDPVERTALQKRLVTLFRSIRIPAEILRELHDRYGTYFNNDIVAVSPANLLPMGHIQTQPKLIVQGDVNFVDALIQTWHEITSTKLLRQPSTSSQTLLFETPVLISEQPNAASSGTVYTRHPYTGEKTTYYIECRWGVGGEIKDTFTFDVRSSQVIAQTIGLQQTQTIRSAATLRESSKDSPLTVTAIPKLLQTSPAMTSDTLRSLVKSLIPIKHKYLHHLKISFECTSDTCFVTEVLPLIQDQGSFKEPAAKSKNTQTATKLFVSAGNPLKAYEQVTNIVDGVGVLRSEYTFATSGMHPAHTVQSKHVQQLVAELTNTMQSYQRVLRDRPLTYRSINFTSAELGSLRGAEPHEQDETNPYLGERGALKLLKHPQLFEIELEALGQVLTTTTTPLRLLLPFVRTPNELTQLFKQIAKHELLAHSQFQVWLQLNTPENILNLTAYPLKHISGVTINIKSLHGLLHGIDPDAHELMHHYPLNHDVLVPLIRKTVKTMQRALHEVSIQNQKQVFIHMEDYDARLLELSIDMGIDGVIVKPQVAPIAKACIMDTEQLVAHGRTQK